MSTHSYKYSRIGTVISVVAVALTCCSVGGTAKWLPRRPRDHGNTPCLAFPGRLLAPWLGHAAAHSYPSWLPRQEPSPVPLGSGRVRATRVVNWPSSLVTVQLPPRGAGDSVPKGGVEARQGSKLSELQVSKPTAAPPGGKGHRFLPGKEKKHGDRIALSPACSMGRSAGRQHLRGLRV